MDRATVLYSKEFLQEIRDRLPVSTVVERTVALKKAGREWKGLSPFNEERTPSFFVNDAKQFYHCFSSGKHGDVFSFLIETQGLAFPEAVERLAGEAGVPLPAVPTGVQAAIERRDGLHAVMEEAVRFYRDHLASPAGDAARAYLGGRGIDAVASEEFRLGYAPADRHGLQRHLAAMGVDLPTMLELGLVARDGTGVPRDRFRNRVLCPIGDAKGRPVAFGGRSLDPSNPAKYLNSPETPLFHKGSLLYNHHGARAAAAEAGRVLAVEGYLDVITLARRGIGHVVSTLGTSVTREQADLLWEMTPEPVLALDGDAAGRRAALRIARASLPHLSGGRTLRFALLPEGVDPDELVRAGGPDAMRGIEARAVPLLDLLWADEASRHPLNSPERLSRMEGRMGALVASMPEGDQRRRYAREVVARLDAIARRPAPRPPGGIRRIPAPAVPASPPRAPSPRRARGPGRPGLEMDLVAAEREFAAAATPEGLERMGRIQAEIAGEDGPERAPPRT
jgi:DNA primase